MAFTHEIKTKAYSITHDVDAATVICKGSLLLNGAKEYLPIEELLNNAVEQQQSNHYLVIDIQALELLNSSGINMMTKVILRKKTINPLLEFTILINKDIVWQKKLARNLGRLMPTLKVSESE